MQPGTDRALSRLSGSLLDPLSLLFKTVSCLNLGIKALRSRSFPQLFIVSVDSLSFGGTGKTPLVMAIGEALEARGARFALISRGYRSRYEKDGIRVQTGHSFIDVGDEALMLKARFPNQEVFIGRDRLRSIAAATEAGIRILVLDDGFQSSHVRKDLCIMLVNPAHPYFYLRHFRFLARRADHMLHYRGNGGAPGPGNNDYGFAITGFLDAGGGRVEIGNAALIAFSALGDNGRFARDMERFNLAAFRSFADHHAFTPKDLRSLEALRREKDASWMVCTEKDFHKLRAILAPGAGARQEGLQDLPLLVARNTIQLPDGFIAAIIDHAKRKGFL